jgi:hypothetical protein
MHAGNIAVIQVNMAFTQLLRDPEPQEGLHRFSKAMTRAVNARLEHAAALSEMRQILPEAMFRRYPAAAQRILAGIKTGRSGAPRARSTAQ